MRNTEGVLRENQTPVTCPDTDKKQITLPTTEHMNEGFCFWGILSSRAKWWVKALAYFLSPPAGHCYEGGQSFNRWCFNSSVHGYSADSSLVGVKTRFNTTAVTQEVPGKLWREFDRKFLCLRQRSRRGVHMLSAVCCNNGEGQEGFCFHGLGHGQTDSYPPTTWMLW